MPCACQVYLTADAEEALEDLDASKIYIIGGIIDRNRHKLICSKKARQQNISMARLPLQEHFKLKGSAVLTIDQVFQLLLCYHVSFPPTSFMNFSTKSPAAI